MTPTYQETEVVGRIRVEFELKGVGMNPYWIYLEARGSIDQDDFSLLSFLLCLDRDPNGAGPTEDELLAGGCPVSNGVPELGHPRQPGMGLVHVQEIDRRINNSVERAVVGRTWASGLETQKNPISMKFLSRDFARETTN